MDSLACDLRLRSCSNAGYSPGQPERRALFRWRWASGSPKPQKTLNKDPEQAETHIETKTHTYNNRHTRTHTHTHTSCGSSLSGTGPCEHGVGLMDEGLAARAAADAGTCYWGKTETKIEPINM